MSEIMQGDVRNSGGGAASECGTGRILQDRLNQLHEDLASKEKAHKVCLMNSFCWRYAFHLRAVHCLMTAPCGSLTTLQSFGWHVVFLCAAV